MQKSAPAVVPTERPSRAVAAEAVPEAPIRKETAAETPEPTALARAESRPEPSPVPTAAPTAVLEAKSSVAAPPPAPAEVDTPAKISRVVKPIYPTLALRARIRGIVLLRVLVSETGAPEQIEVLKGVGGGLSEAAVTAVRKWTFEPARRNGQAVKSWTTVPIPFEPEAVGGPTTSRNRSSSFSGRGSAGSPP